MGNLRYNTRHDFISRDGQDEKQQVENRVGEFKIPFEFVFKLPSMRKARMILARDQMGHILSSAVPQMY